jgi:hypothetical protein
MSSAHPGAVGRGQAATRMDAAARVLDPVPAGPDGPPGVQEVS